MVVARKPRKLNESKWKKVREQKRTIKEHVDPAPRSAEDKAPDGGSKGRN